MEVLTRASSRVVRPQPACLALFSLAPDELVSSEPKVNR